QGQSESVQPERTPGMPLRQWPVGQPGKGSPVPVIKRPVMVDQLSCQTQQTGRLQPQRGQPLAGQGHGPITRTRCNSSHLITPDWPGHTGIISADGGEGL